ncbi:DNA binding protein [Phytophthora megakarya]|uniref:DNA binding protein n=1 Tax=Phytophthora megakarya TaxID=4795 RepID=A0A225VMB4_9STRA|nr:DNA binding protein [Phytophthora megakarya]
MLQNDYGYSHYQAPHHSGERPKLFGSSMDNGQAGGYHGPGMHDFQQLVHPTNMTPQHHMQTPQHQTPQHQQGDFDHEPIMMNMQHPQYYAPPPMTAQMLHVSTDYNSGGSAGGVTPSHAGSKRSREELNMKEKKRMFKLNDRINQLKSLLDDAGVQSKKNKQSILDNTYHYISMLRSNLLIAKQKAERAEKQADGFRSQAQTGGPMDAVFKRCFDQSSTPRLVVDLNMQLTAVNSAFLAQTAQTEDSLMDVNTLRACLCLDNGKLDAVVQSVTSTLKPISAIVQAQGAGNNIATLTLMASVLTDDDNVVTAVEFSLVPFEISSDFSSPNGNTYTNDVKQDMHKEASPSGVSDLAV